MKFLALGLLMFLQAGQSSTRVFIGDDGRCYRVNPAFDKASQIDNSACRDQLKNTGIINAIPATRTSGQPQQAVQIPAGETVTPNLIVQGTYWDGKEAAKDVITFSSTQGGTQSLSVPSNWKCTPFTDGKPDADLVGMVCTKPKQK
jgi:hypothetical protein